MEQSIRLLGVGRCVKEIQRDLDPGVPITVGRADGNVIQITRRPGGDDGDFEYLSRFHCLLEWHRGKGWMIEDNGSTNGTSIIDGRTKREQPVQGSPQPIQLDDIIRLADCDHFLIQVVEAELAPPRDEVVDEATLRLLDAEAACLQLIHKGVAVRVLELRGGSVFLTGTATQPEEPGSLGIPETPSVLLGRIVPHNRGFALEPTAGVPTERNRVLVHALVPLQDGDLITWPESPRVSLLFFDPGTQAARNLSDLLLSQSRIVIGRAASATVRLRHPSLSNEHAEIVKTSGSLVLRDLGSTNGTRVNGRPIQGAVELRPGDQVTLGTVPFLADQLCWDGDAERPRIDLLLDGVSYPPRRLHPLTLAVPQAQLVALLGPSGCGKSTLLDIVAQYLQSPTGAIYVNGQKLSGSGLAAGLFRRLCGYLPEQPSAPAVGLVPQHDQVAPMLKVGELLTGAAIRAGLAEPAAFERAKTEAERCAILRLWDEVVIDSTGRPRVSGGQLKRISVALELIRQPQILLLDEPTAAQDSKNGENLVTLFRGLAQQGLTILMSTHRLADLAHCHLAVVMAIGRVVFVGPPQQVPRYFGADSIEKVYALLPDQDHQHAAELAETFRKSSWYERYCSL